LYSVDGSVVLTVDRLSIRWRGGWNGRNAWWNV